MTHEAGDQAVELAASVGVRLDPWQQHVLRVMLSERADDRWAAFEVAMLVARQNGKGEVLLARELAGLFLFGERLILHSAHEFKTASEAFLRIKSVIENCDDLHRRVARYRTAHGDEGIELADGARLRFVARSRSSGRGFTGDCIIMDECQQLPRSAIGALLPTLSARPNPQVVYAGTVPEPGNDSEHFESLRDRGRSGDDGSLAWLEWSPESETPDLDDRSVWAQANPALGIRIDEEAIERERASMGDEHFARERLSVWPTAGFRGPIDLDRWTELADVEASRPSPVAIAVAVSQDRQWGHIGLAGMRADGRRHLQVARSGRGTGWLVEAVGEMVEAHKPVGVAVNPGSPAGALVPGLNGAGVDTVQVSGRELGQATGMVLDGVRDGTIAHQGQQVLGISVEAARLRDSGGAQVWDHRCDVAPLEAVTLALFALSTVTVKPRSGVVW